MDYKERKVADAKITEAFLSRNAAKVGDVVNAFKTKLNELNARYHTYLKGGNAIALLKRDTRDVAFTDEEKRLSGDYDFQVVPHLNEYNANWEQNLDILDRKITEALIHAAGAVQFDDATNEDIFDTVAPKDRTRKSKTRGLSHIGRDYMSKTFLELARDAKYEDGRLGLSKEQISSYEDRFPDKGLMVYVNYTIPGFILYRLVYRYRYTTASGTEYSLKSEVIDVSVPRKGSGEVYLSQENVITKFRIVEGFTVPGWGYHFYENTNLLQEILLGTSGSVHKRGKREERLATAASILIEAQEDNTINSKSIFEPHNTQEAKILGYVGALMNNVYDYGVYNREAIECMRKRLKKEIQSHLQTVGANEKNSSIYYKFRIDNSIDTTVRDDKKVKEFFNAVLNGYNAQAQSTEALNERTYKILSPFSNMKGIFPTDYGVADIKEPAFTALKNYMLNNFKGDIVFGEEADAANRYYICLMRGKGGVFYMIFQKCREFSAAVPVQDVLSRTILESQRRALVNYIQGKASV